MSRSTQYIGLTAAANKWVKSAFKVEDFELTTGMFGEPIPGRIYHIAAAGDRDLALVATEEVQIEPWSSGPMIFTHLRITVVNDSGQRIDCGYYYSWVMDPTVENEYDYERGAYFV